MGTATSYTVRVCDVMIGASDVISPRKDVDGLTVRVCRCTIKEDNTCWHYEACLTGYIIKVCEVGADCSLPRVAISWDVTATWSTKMVSGTVSWTNPAIGCTLRRIQLWAAIPPSGGIGECEPGVETDCEWHELYDRSVNPACQSCAILPNGDRSGKKVSCDDPSNDDLCADQLGLIAGKDEEVHISQRLSPGASFVLFGYLVDSDGARWARLGDVRYESTGVDGGGYGIEAAGIIPVSRGNRGDVVANARNVDRTAYAAGTWGHVMKLGCKPAAGGGYADSYTSEDVCRTSSALYVLPVAPTSDVGEV